MTDTLSAWQGDFGDAYTERNVVEWSRRLPAFQTMFAGLSLTRVLEVGCNRGHNLAALAALLPAEAEIVGIEPNLHALEIARVASPHASALYGHALDIAFRNDYFDLVFTAGVLIHISPADLDTAFREIVRVSRRYILAVEYFAEEETPVEYRGQTGLLWKRDFKAAYLECCPNLKLLRSGFWDMESGFDRTTWWLFQKV